MFECGKCGVSGHYLCPRCDPDNAAYRELAAANHDDEIASKDALLDDLESAVEEAQARESVLVEALTEMLAVRAYVRGTRKTQANKQARKALANTEKETR